MGKTIKHKKPLLHSPFLIAILVIWFASNLISQMIYMVVHGTPYDGIVMLESLGPIYYAILVIETVLWFWLLIFVSFKAISFSRVPRTKKQNMVNS